MEINPEADWPIRETVHEEEVLVATRARIHLAHLICCPEHGVRTAVHLDVQGIIAGIPLELTIELTLEGAEAVGQKFLEVREAMKE